MINSYLPQLHYFFLVAKYKSYTLAAQKIGVSQAAMSLQIKKLEFVLQIGLFDRVHKKQVRLTQQGLLLFQTCQSVFGQVEAAHEKILQQELQGDIYVNSHILLGSFTLITFKKIFEDKHPGLKIILNLTDDEPNIQKDVFDIMIRRKFRSHINLEYIELGGPIQIPVASTKYLKKNSLIKTAQNLTAHELITENSDCKDWNEWLNQIPLSKHPQLKNLIYIQNPIAQFEAVKADMGIAHLPIYLVQDLLKSGTLKIVLPKLNPRRIYVYAAYVKNEFVPKKIHLFISELKKYYREQGFDTH